jgi:hypothetical protein
VGAVYTQAYNRRHDKSGHLFQGRFKAILVEKESHLLEVIRYVVLNPVRAGAAKAPEDWPWSSYQGTCGRGEVHPSLSTDWVLGNFGQERQAAVSRFRSFVREGMTADSPFEKVRGQVVLGGERFFEMLQPLFEGKSEINEIPRRQRVAGRPELDALFAAVQSRDERNEKIVEAVEQCGYSQKEVADRLGLHYSAVSRIVGVKLRGQTTDDGGQQTKAKGSSLYS